MRFHRSSSREDASSHSATSPRIIESPSASDSDEASYYKASRDLSNASHRSSGVELELATARLVWDLHYSTSDELTLEKDSVYGAAILLPQLARSAGWPKYLTIHAIRSYFFLLVNLLLQGWLIMSINKEQEIYDAFGGQMYLCDFKEGFMGPGGTKVDSASRLYASFNQWNTRVFVRDSLIASFPEQKDHIMEKVDPGEYAMESGACRSVCSLLFVVATLEEFYLIWHLVRLLFNVPTRADSWLHLPHGNSETGDARVRIAGIPLMWKAFYLIIVLLPKVALWKMTMQTGFTYIMDTAEISNLIVNAVALGFILTIDEMVCSVFFTEDLKAVLRSCESYSLKPKAADDEDEEEEDDWASNDAVLVYYRGQRGRKAWRMRDLLTIVPIRVVMAIFWFVLFTAEYYYRNCQWSSEDSNYVSRTRYLPLSSQFDLLNFVLPNFFPLSHGDTPFWTMHTEEG